MNKTQSNLWKLAFAVIAIITASVCSFIEGKVDMQAKMAHFEQATQ